MTKFSIIIPCYNRFKMMDQCLKSLEEQTFKDFEVILVDDCSTDDSYERLEEYKKNSNLNIKLFQNATNVGPGKSRNYAIEQATGKFMLCLDSDDFLREDTLEILNGVVEEKRADCVIFDCNYVTKNNCIPKKSVIQLPQGMISKSDALIYSTSSTFGKMYLLKNIKENHIKFPNLYRNEDLPFNKLAISVSDSIYYCKQYLYYYVDNPNSLVHDKTLIDIQNNIEGFEIVEESLKDKYPKEVEAIFLKHYLYATTMNLVRKKTSTKEIKKHIEKSLERYPTVFDNTPIESLTKFQKMCVQVIRMKLVVLLRLLIMLRNIVKKIR